MIEVAVPRFQTDAVVGATVQYTELELLNLASNWEMKNQKGV